MENNLDKEGRPLEYAKDEKSLRPEWHNLPREFTFPSTEDIACEAQLSAIGVWEALDFNIKGWHNDKKEMEEWWRPFQPKKGVMNDRDSILLYGAKNANPWDPCGLAQMAVKNGIKPSEDSMTYPTIAKDKLTCLREVFDYFDLGRSFLIKLNRGGHYPPHRDHILLNRPTVRLIAFLGDSTDNMRWEVEDQVVRFSPDTLYYVDTRKSHRLWSAENESTMVVMNVIKDWKNTMKILSRLKHR